MLFTKGPWKFYRQIGIGERQHVRSGLLGILFTQREQLETQIAGAIRAADSLNMMLRAHINVGALPSAELDGILKLMYLNASHQLETWKNLPQEQYKTIVQNSEIIITGKPDDNTELDIQLGIMEIWTRSAGRFLQGNHGGFTFEQLRASHPNMFYNPMDFYEAWNA